MQNWEPLNANETHTHHHELQSNLILLTSDYEILDFHDFFFKIVQTRELPIWYMQNWEALNANKTDTHHHELQRNLILLTSDYEILDFHDFFWKTRELPIWYKHQV